MMSKNSIAPFLKDYLIKFLTRPFLLDTNETDKENDRNNEKADIWSAGKDVLTAMGEEHRINEIKGVIISRALLKEYGYDGDMPTDKQMQVIGNGLLEYWGVSDGFKEALASTMENMFGVKAKD